MFGWTGETLHPKVHGGLLGVRGNPIHEQQMEELGIQKIDLTILNLYPFKETVASGANFAQCVENIDIGGPSMLRSTAKNHAFTTICTSPDQYGALMADMEAHQGGTTLALRKRFAAKAFGTSAAYDAAIAAYFANQLQLEQDQAPVVVKVNNPEFALKYDAILIRIQHRSYPETDTIFRSTS
jgi:phosphoribosylaminoimidazolecarboxamide formyltransferase/IMP cyclohydrolase